MTAGSRVVAPASGPLRGRLRVPGDKSIAHRALIFAGLGQGRARVRGLPDGADVRSSLAVMRGLGLQAEGEGTDLVLRGAAGRLSEPAQVLDCGNSGTTMRLCCGLLAGQPFLSVLTGDDSLRRRPMGRVLAPLAQLGARVDGRGEGSLAPLVLRGRRPLAGGRFVGAVASAQVKTALLLAGLQAAEPVEVVQPGPSRDHGERLLRAMGAALDEAGGPEGSHRVAVRPGAPLELVDVDVPGDLSSAVFLLVAAAIVPGSSIAVEGVGVNPTRTAALDVLRAMGLSLSVQDPALVGGEPRATLRVEGGARREVALRGVPVQGPAVAGLLDEIPALAVAAAFAHGATVFRDAAELRVKESDRIATTVAMLRALGASVEALPDGLVVHGSGGAPLPGGRVDAAHDHRIALAAMVAGLGCAAGAQVDGADVVDVSFPGFPLLLEQLRAGRPT
ncbi:3-phosphoshikimate 1-carboxyvinyltransferase [Myxococcota bacterium]|nr:3-phosphoshikimate 1-carboxyvinyltransferase [Myxococcota bacterium]